MFQQSPIETTHHHPATHAHIESEPLSFSGTQIRAHGVDPESVVHIGCQSFITPLDRRINGTPFAPVCEPDGDAYLGFLGIGASGPKEISISLRTLPGLVDYYREIGLLTPDNRIIEVDPDLSRGKTPGYPGGDALSMLERDPTAVAALHAAIGDHPGALVGTFMSTYQREQAARLGLRTIQTADPRVTSNKGDFRLSASEFGYRVVRGFSLHNSYDVSESIKLVMHTVVSRIARGERPGESGWIGAWMKLSHGSGGDFVQPLAVTGSAIKGDMTAVHAILERTGSIDQTVRELFSDEQNSLIFHEARRAVGEAYLKLRASTEKAFEENSYGDDALERFWRSKVLAPNPLVTSIVVEQDIRAYGEIVANASNLLVLHSDGRNEVRGWFKQLTGAEGDYRGSAPFSPIETLGIEGAEDLAGQIEGVTEYCRTAGLLGFAGVDFFSVRDADGVVRSYMTEVNGRIPISGTAAIIAQKVHAPAWINVNLEASLEITSISGFLEHFGESALQDGDSLETAKVLPQAFRTLQDSAGNVIPSAKFKALIVGPTQKECELLLNTLAERGIIR